MIELLKAAAKLSKSTNSEALPDDILRFTLEYGSIPDLNEEKQKLANLLEGDGFDLFHYSIEDDPEILILQFQGVPREQSAEFLFATADALVDALKLETATPETDAAWREPVLGDEAGTEGVGDLVSGFCISDAPSPNDPHWAPSLIRAPDAMAAFNVDGSQVRVGQPDTGVADHREIDPGVAKNLGFNTLDNTADPTDPLTTDMKSPGHGTATSSVVISRPSHTIVGSAPGATLVPIRCLNHVVISGGSAVAKAIDHARKKDCRVITMSLGGPFSGRALKRAISRAVADDMIVLAAAGNCVGFVVYPAWDENVIAVAAIDENKERWKGSSHGEKIDIAAPGENVHVARRNAGTTSTPEQLRNIDKRGQGTSYAVALTAGVAALWIERFGHQAVKAEAARRNSNVQELFRAALRATANKPGGWDTHDMGAGIVDAHALLSLRLDRIPAVKTPPDAHPSRFAFGNLFHGGRHANESAFIAADWLLRHDPNRIAGLESAIAPRPSPGLSKEFEYPEEVGDLPAPASLAGPDTPALSVNDALRRLAATSGGGLESAANVTAEAALERVRNEGVNAIMDGVRGRLLSKRENDPDDKIDPNVQDRALGEMERVVSQMASPERAIDLTRPTNRFALEALVRLTGRPALRILGNDQELNDPNIGSWAAELIHSRTEWRKLTDAVGRIDVKHNGKWLHGGTGFVIQPGVIMTNRHVLDIFAEPLPSAAGEQKFVFTRDVSIIFDPEASDETTRFKVKSVVTAGGKRIGKYVDLAKLDVAVLEIETSNGQSDHPAAINVEPVSTSDQGIQKILLAGYPAKPSFSDGPSDPGKTLAFWDRLGELYGDDYGLKYMSPGRIVSRPGDVAGDGKNWAFTHDATTLRGNSGSAVISLDGDMNFCGLHFGGSTLKHNYAHDIHTVLAGGDGVFKPETIS